MPATRRQYDTPTKCRFIGAVKAGQPVKVAAGKENIGLATAYRLVKKFDKMGSTDNIPRRGRPPKLSKRTTRILVQEARKHRRKPLGDLGKSITPVVSEATVRRALDREGYHRRVARKVPYLRPQHRKARVAWARKNQGMTAEDWARIIWSDECYVYMGDTRGPVHVTRRADEVLHDDCVVPTFKQSSLRVMVWGCIIRGRLGPLVVLEYPGGRGGGMNSQRYQEQVLEAHLKSFYQEMSQERGLVQFQQDGASSHTSKSTMRWLRNQHIKLFGHTANSPDISAIEPLWHELKTKIRSRPHIPSNLDELKQAVKEAWESISVEAVNKQIDRMPDCVAAVLAAKGGHTGF